MRGYNTLYPSLNHHPPRWTHWPTESSSITTNSGRHPSPPVHYVCVWYSSANSCNHVGIFYYLPKFGQQPPVRAQAHSPVAAVMHLPKPY